MAATQNYPPPFLYLWPLITITMLPNAKSFL
jgi:hypothetical protein